MLLFYREMQVQSILNTIKIQIMPFPKYGIKINNKQNDLNF